MTKKPVISVIIPAHNEQDFIARCLGSLANQKNAPNYEIIVVDNNSNDDTAKIAKAMGAKVIHEDTQGVTRARNAGLKIAKGEIIVSTDADTYFKDDWLEYIGDFFWGNPKAMGLAGHYHFVKGPLWARCWPVMGAILVWLMWLVLRKTIYVSGANFAFRRRALAQYDTRHPQGGDEIEALKTIQECGPVHATLSNAVYTSSRRVNQGFLHSMWTVGYYYTFNVWHTKLSGGASTIGSMPIVRTESRMAHWRLIAMQWLAILGVTLMIIWLSRV